MKFLAALSTVLLISPALVAGSPTETNAQRMARGLPPLRPQNLLKASQVEVANRHHPSGHPGGQCNTGSVQCCDTLTNSKDPVASAIAGLLGITLPANVGVGLSCSALHVIGVGGNSCSAQTVCCSNNQYNGLINVGCSPINLGI